MSEYFRKPIVKTLMLKGQEGQSIKGIEKTSTSGLVDTYTITLTDGTTSTFTVTNGKQGDGLQNLQIGGRNLIFRTKTLGKLAYDLQYIYGGGVGTETYKGFTVLETSKPVSSPTGYQDILSLVPSSILQGDAYYTVSFWAKCDTGTASCDSFFYPDVVTDGVGQRHSEIDTAWKRFSFTWKTKSDIKADVVLQLVFARIRNTDDYNKVYTCGFKFEQGSKPTDWTPAPEDFEAEIAKLQAEIDALKNK